MPWIKRNLFFVIGAVVALALVVVAALYSWNQYGENDKAREELGLKYEELKRLNNEKPHPGNEKIDNVKIAREQQARVNKFLQQAATHFSPIPPIPDTGGRAVIDRDFANALSATVQQLRKNAEVAGVIVASNYNFTFEVQKTNLLFGKESLRPLAGQLGDIKAICDIVFAARVNSLESLRRERVAPDDSQGYTDYHDRSSVTNNEMALLAPYDVTVRCFSGELGKLLAGFANASHPILVQRVNVERATPAGNAFAAATDPATGLPTAQAWGRGGFGGGARGRGRPVPVINEEPVKVTLWLEVVKLKPAAK